MYIILTIRFGVMFMNLKSRFDKVCDRVAEHRTDFTVNSVIGLLRSNRHRSFAMYMQWISRIRSPANIQDREENRLLSVILKSKNYVDTENGKFLQISMDVGCNPNHLNGDGTTALHVAVKLNFPGALLVLLNEVRDMSEEFRGTLIRLAAKHAKFEVLELLLSRTEFLNAINTQDIYGRTALMLAASAKHDERSVRVARLLLRCGADVGIENSYGHTARHECLRHTEMTSAFLDENVDFNVTSNPRTAIVTPLGYAVGLGNARVIQMLVERGNCNVNDCTLFRSSAAHLSASMAHVNPNIFRYVVGRGAIVHQHLANLDAVLIVFRNALQRLMFAIHQTQLPHQTATVNRQQVVNNMMLCFKTAMVYGYTPTIKLLELIFRYPVLTPYTLHLTRAVLNAVHSGSPSMDIRQWFAVADPKHETFGPLIYEKHSSELVPPPQTQELLAFIALLMSEDRNGITKKIERPQSLVLNPIPMTSIRLGQPKNTKTYTTGGDDDDDNSNNYRYIKTLNFEDIAQNTLNSRHRSYLSIHRLFKPLELNNVNSEFYKQCVSELLTMKNETLASIRDYSAFTLHALLVNKRVPDAILAHKHLNWALQDSSIHTRYTKYGHLVIERYFKLRYDRIITVDAKTTLSEFTGIDFVQRYSDVCDYLFDNFLSEMDLYKLSVLNQKM